MKVSKKMKISALIGLLTVGVITIACSSINSNNNNESLTSNQNTWQAKYPQVFNNVGYQKLIESSPKIDYSKLPESQQELVGKITNPFGIRDDILEYILKNYSNSENPYLFKAVLLLAQNKQIIYYGNISKDDAIKLADKDFLLKGCILTYTGGFTNIDSLMRNTKQRDDHMWEIDNKYFAYQVITSGYTTAREDEICKNGEF